MAWPLPAYSNATGKNVGTHTYTSNEIRTRDPSAKVVHYRMRLIPVGRYITQDEIMLPRKQKGV